jgi:hypothetical protein
VLDLRKRIEAMTKYTPLFPTDQNLKRIEPMHGQEFTPLLTDQLKDQELNPRHVWPQAQHQQFHV